MVVVTLALLSSIFLGFESAWADSVIHTFDVGNGPNHMTFNPSNNGLHVSNFFPTWQECIN
ncbi:MAG: hypothetical protein ACJ72R_19600 [Nitrososphaeraceae archaeon]